MIEDIMSAALGNGLWAALFCLLFLYQLRDSRAREKKYAETIDSLTAGLSGVHELKHDCAEIEEALSCVKSDTLTIKSDSAGIKADTAVIRQDCSFVRSVVAFGGGWVREVNRGGTENEL